MTTAPMTSPTLRRRVLAAELKELRLAAGMTHVDVADRLGWPQAKVSKIEGAKQTASVEAVMALADVCSAPADQRDRLVELARAARVRGWWATYKDMLPADQAMYVGLETDADLVWTFAVETLPDLLQTSDYAQAVLHAQTESAEASLVERRLQLLLDRQRGLVEGGAIEFYAVIAESALRRAVGGARVLHDQLAHLATLASQPSVTIRVVPFATGALPVEGPFTVLRFEEYGHPDVVFVSTRISRTLFEESATVASFRGAARDLESLALTPAESCRFIESMAEEVGA